MNRTATLANLADVTIVTSRSNMRYCSGFTGDSGACIVGAGRRVLISDFRYTEQASQQAPDWEYREFERGDEYELMGAIAAEMGAKSVAWEESALTIAKSRAIGAALTETLGAGIAFCDASLPLQRARAVKDEVELDAIRRACAIGDAAFAHLLGVLQPGMTEIEIALVLETKMRQLGATGTSFETIVASGEHGSLPHAVPSQRTVQEGDLITLDFGCVLDGYCSDMTRTVALGELAPEARNVYNKVLEAQKAACAGICAGLTGREADAIARDLLANAGYGSAFGHGLGHGVGIDIHEEPRLSPASETVLTRGMVVTIEPGVYLAGRFGVRIEDCGVLTDSGFESFTHAPKDLIQI